MSRLFEVKAVVPDLTREVLKSKRVRAMVLNEMKGVGKDIVRDLYRTVRFWKHTVTFTYRIHYAGGDVYFEVGPIGSSRGKMIWTYIDQGTQNIPFYFNKEYKPKTTPGKLDSTPGEFTLPRERIRRRKDFPSPPGIKARGWSVMLQKQYADILYDAVDFAIRRGLEE